MKKVSTLEGFELDCWVAKVLDSAEKVYLYGDRFGIRWNRTPPAYSTDWAYGGPLIDQFCIDLDQDKARAAHVRCRALIDGQRKHNGLSIRVDGWGPLPLVAAMRALVASKFGDEVLADQPAAHAA